MSRYYLLLIATFCQQALAATPETCKKIHSEDKRLACYDDIHGYQPSTDTQNVNSDKVLKRSSFAILPHRQSYFMPISYNDNRQTIDNLLQDVESPPLDETEVKFQLSFKMNLWDEILGEKTQLMVGYTQKSYWQMYNSELSSLFRETNYEPEIFLSKQSNYEIFGLNLVNSSLGFVHQSNGRSSLLSRSWNRVYANFVFQKENFVLPIKPWWRISEDFEDDDNPDIDDYLGKYEIGMLYQWHDNEFTLMLRNLNNDNNAETFQLGWSFPLNDKVSFYTEYFQGYGESLIDYDHKNKSFSLGFSITDWVE